MRILYITNARIPTEKAHGIQIMKMCEAFAREGNDVTLLAPWRFNPIKDDPFQYYGVKRVFRFKTLPSFDLVGIGKVGFIIQMLSFSLFSTLYALFVRTDYLYSRDELPLLILSFFKKHIAFEIHTPRNNGIVALLLKRAQKIITISHGLKDFCIDIGVDPKQILVAHDGVDLSSFQTTDQKDVREKLHLPVDRPIIGYVGKYKTMGKEKGVKELLEAFAQVHTQTPKTFLLLVGINKSELQEVEKKLVALGLHHDAYKIVTHIPPTHIPPYLFATDVLVMNYPDTEHYAYYMSPLKLFEYMAAQRVIVATDLPSIREILHKDNAILVEPGNVSSLVGGIINALDSNSVSFARNARSDVEYYTWVQRAKRISTFLKDLCK